MELNSLGFSGKPEDTRVVVAMSGGVDSSVVAAMLKDEGYDVVGITLQLYDHGAAVPGSKTCCAGQDIQDARRVSEMIGIPHYVLDYESRFRESVMDDFADTYLAGATPIPCVRCNQTVKFKDLLETARDLGAQCMATGHYIQRVDGIGKANLLRGADPIRDQSYFLFATTQEQLDFLRFPLGHLKSKDETRALAAKYGLQVADKPDSQDICFVPNGKYTSVIEKLRPGAIEPGHIVHLDGRVLGDHEGIIHYTVGQRRGLGIGGGDPLFVVRLDPIHHRVIVGPKEALETAALDIDEVNWIGDQPLTSEPQDVMVKVRSTQSPAQAQVRANPDRPGWAVVRFATPEVGVSPGQACVLYDESQNDRLLGGGWIRATQSAYVPEKQEEN